MNACKGLAGRPDWAWPNNAGEPALLISPISPNFWSFLSMYMHGRRREHAVNDWKYPSTGRRLAATSCLRTGRRRVRDADPGKNKQVYMTQILLVEDKWLCAERVQYFS
jgi:hypothetical protein